jgi:hypothetical protein
MDRDMTLTSGQSAWCRPGTCMVSPGCLHLIMSYRRLKSYEGENLRWGGLTRSHVTSEMVKSASRSG